MERTSGNLAGYGGRKDVCVYACVGTFENLAEHRKWKMEKG
jgi:hypothetical protein